MSHNSMFEIPDDKNESEEIWDKFRLDDAVGVRPSLIQYELPINRSFLKHVLASVSKRKEFGMRMGKDWMPQKFQKIEQEEDWVPREHFEPLNDVCTKFCTETFFPNARARMNMIGNILRFLKACEVTFGTSTHPIFKGGVMLRVLLLQFWRNHSQEAREEAVQYLKDNGAIGIGDFDFQLSYEKWLSHEDMYRTLFLHTIALIWLQRQMEDEMANRRPADESGLMCVQWDKKEKEEKLTAMVQEAVSALPSDNPLRGAKVKRVYVGSDIVEPPSGFTTRNGLKSPTSRKNICIFSDREGETCITEIDSVLPGVVPRTSGKYLYTTCSMHIGEEMSQRERVNQLNAHFHLARIKHTFTMYYETKDGKKRCDRLSGEMVDISLACPDDEAFRYYGSIPGKYREYPIVGVSRSLVTIQSYSPLGFFLDHNLMIHRTDSRPWEVKKYSKRLLRYCSLFIIYTFSPFVSGDRTTKMKAVGKLIHYLSQHPSRITSSPFPRTDLSTVDFFAESERNSLVQDITKGNMSEAKRYLVTLVKHLSVIVNCLQISFEQRKKLSFTAIDATDLSYMHKHIFN